MHKKTHTFIFTFKRGVFPGYLVNECILPDLWSKAVFVGVKHKIRRIIAVVFEDIHMCVWREKFAERHREVKKDE